MAKYTDEQIKKVLECCGAPTTTSKLSCNSCPILGTRNCMALTNRYALDLINRQEAEKAELQREIASYKSEISELKSELTLIKNDYEQCKSVYAEEKAKVAMLNDKLITAYKLLKTAKSEAIKEFAERLKKSAFDCDVSFGFGREHYTEAVTVFEIDNLVKEMVGEGE